MDDIDGILLVNHRTYGRWFKNRWKETLTLEKCRHIHRTVSSWTNQNMQGFSGILRISS